jgi:hypothetical protein
MWLHRAIRLARRWGRLCFHRWNIVFSTDSSRCGGARDGGQPSLSADQVQNIVKQSADDLGAAGWDRLWNG